MATIRFLLLLRASVPAAAGTEGGNALTTHSTDRTYCGERRASSEAGVPRAAASASQSACKHLTSLHRSSLQHQQSRPQAAHRRPRRLLTVQLRLPAAGWAPRRRRAAAVAQLEHVASDGQRGEFCTREHSSEHGSGTTGDQKAQGWLSAPSAAALLASGASASPRCTRATRGPFEFFQRIRPPASFGTCAAAQNLLRLLWPSTIKRLPTALQGP